MAKSPENKIIDFISGIEVNATPEEVEAVQVFSRQLVEDYGYGKEQIQTRPQFRVKARPSDTKKEYPVSGQRFEDSGKFKQKDLKPTHNLKAIFKSIRNPLAANTVGATRDEVLARQLINMIFCKLYDEKNTAPDSIVKFRAGVAENPKEVETRISEIFNDVRTFLPEVIDNDDRISLDTNSIVYVVGELQN